MPDFFIDQDIAGAKTIHTDFYTSPEIFDLCKEKIFAPSWQFIGNTDLANKEGEIYPFILLENFMNEPLALVRDKSGNLNLLSNVCTHDVERPNKMRGYPVLPIIFIIFTSVYIGVTLYTDIHNYWLGKTTVINSGLGLFLTGIGIPLYFYFRKKKQLLPDK